MATRARAIVNFRILPGDSIDGVLQKIRETIHDPRVKITVKEGLKSEPSPVADTESEGYQSIKQAIHAVFPDVLVVPGLVLATTDSRHYVSLAYNVLHFSPTRLNFADLLRIHGKDERISMKGYGNLVQFYIQLLKAEGRTP